MVESQHQPQQRQEEEVDDPPPPPLPTPQNMAQHRLFVPFILGGFLLSLNAGYLNACFLFGEFRQPVGHVTGTITKVTRLLSTGLFEEAWGTSITVLGFFTGSLLSGLLIKKTTFQLRPRYGLAIIIEGCLLLASSLFLDLVDGSSRWADFLASVACGLQVCFSIIFFIFFFIFFSLHFFFFIFFSQLISLFFFSSFLLCVHVCVVVVEIECNGCTF